jgi:hypothetical protein
MELDPRDYAADFEHAKANLATRTAESAFGAGNGSHRGRERIRQAGLRAELHSEPLGWIEEQLRAPGHEKDSRELAVHLFCAFQGMAAMAHSANHPELIAMEVRRLKDWIRTVL